MILLEGKHTVAFINILHFLPINPPKTYTLVLEKKGTIEVDYFRPLIIWVNPERTK